MAGIRGDCDIIAAGNSPEIREPDRPREAKRNAKIGVSRMTVEAAIQADLDALLLPWQDVSARRMFGGNGYFVGDRLFANCQVYWVAL